MGQHLILFVHCSQFCKIACLESKILLIIIYLWKLLNHALWLNIRFLSGSNLTTCVLKSTKYFLTVVRKSYVYGKMVREMQHCWLWRQKKGAMKQDYRWPQNRCSPRASRKEGSFIDTLILTQWDPMSDFWLIKL